MSRIVIFVGILGLANAYVGWRLAGRLPMAAPLSVLWIVLTGFFFLQLAAPFGDRLLFPEWRDRFGGERLFTVLDWLSYLALGILSCLLLYGLLADLMGLMWKWVESRPLSVDFNRRALITLGLATAGTAIVGVSQALAKPEVVAVDIPLRNLPPEFDGFRMVQISDLHAGPIIGRAYVETVVAKAMSANPDLIVLTGDFVDGEAQQLRDDLAPLGQLSAPHGLFFIPGNHEYYWGLDDWLEEFRALGATPLMNEHRVVERDGRHLVLAGITDLAARRFEGVLQPDVDQALGGAPSDVPRILLAHQPNSYVLAEGKGIDLQLSGHTHAGQYFPFTLLIGLFHRYYKGLNRHGDMWIYVNRGTGFWGPPMRTGNPSEITVLTLRSETAG
jgi:predicted MPP superfamily phosphohydrolase